MTHCLNKILSTAVATFFMVSGVQAANCTGAVNASVTGSTGPDSTSIAVGPFTTRCTGGISGQLNPISGSRWVLTLQLEQQVSGVWKLMETNAISGIYAPGTYRFSVRNANTMGPSNWSLDYKTGF